MLSGVPLVFEDEHQLVQLVCILCEVISIFVPSKGKIDIFPFDAKGEIDGRTPKY